LDDCEHACRVGDNQALKNQLFSLVRQLDPVASGVGVTSATAGRNGDITPSSAVTKNGDFGVEQA